MKLTRRELFATLAGAAIAPQLTEPFPIGGTYSNKITPASELTLEALEAAVADLEAFQATPVVIFESAALAEIEATVFASALDRRCWTGYTVARTRGPHNWRGWEGKGV